MTRFKGVLLGLLVLSLISSTMVTAEVTAEKRIGISPPDYSYVPVTPGSKQSGQWTAFNVGDEDLQVYAEYRNAPGDISIEWQQPDPNVAPEDQWQNIPDIFIPAGERRYGRYIMIVGDLVQGQFYNWSIVCGYYDPDSAFKAEAGFRLNFIWPFPADTDKDGIYDSDEKLIYGTNATNADTDGDGLNDRAEIFDYRTQPTLPDTDYDGLSDGLEIRVYQTNPNDKDTDSDGILDGLEIESGTDPLDGNSPPKWYKNPTLYFIIAAISGTMLMGVILYTKIMKFNERIPYHDKLKVE